jgi:hypothetical protein
MTMQLSDAGQAVTQVRQWQVSQSHTHKSARRTCMASRTGSALHDHRHSLLLLLEWQVWREVGELMH